MISFGCGGSDAPIRPIHLEEILDEAVYNDPDPRVVRPAITYAKRGIAWRRSIGTKTASRLTFQVRVPAEPSLSVSLSNAEDETTITYRIVARNGDRETVVLDETYTDSENWQIHRVSLSEWAGQDIDLVFETISGEIGAEASWAAPTLFSDVPSDRPNVIFYVIDAAGADYMSVYGYERPTTPFLEELAAEGIVFERAYSPSTWTKISTPSFLTSLHSSALRATDDQTARLPAGARTIGEYLHEVGYLTASITSNPFAGRMTGLERGLDLLRDGGVAHNAVSSVELHANFWQWRRAYPAWPYWVHLQTTDVHWPWQPVEPFLGSFTTAAEREQFYAWERELAAALRLSRPQWLHAWRYPLAMFEETGIDRHEFFSIAKGLYDESMLHNDAQLRRLVGDLKARGEWDNMLLIIASDHGSAHGIGDLEEIPDRTAPIMGSMRTRVPMIFIWPGHLEPRRIEQPVSMMNIVPTVLEITGAEVPQALQGKSLASFLRGEDMERGPVVLDEVYAFPDGIMSGWLEIIDGRWGASRHSPVFHAEDPIASTEVRICDLLLDPECVVDVADLHPDMVDKYAAALQRHWDTQGILAAGFTASDNAELSPEQIEALRALGYIR